VSLILDALNRSRDNVDPVPTLATRHPVEPVPAGGRQYVPWVVLLLALALIAWLVWDRFSTPPDTESPVAELTRNIGSAASAVTSELKARAEEREGALQPAASPPEPEKIGETTAAVAQDRVAATAPALPVELDAPPEPEVSERVPPATADPAVARLYRDRSVADKEADIEPGSVESTAPVSSAPASDSKRKEQPIDIEDILRRAQAESGNARLDDHPVPFLSSLSQQTKNEVPTIYYQRHDYSSDASQSAVTLNGKTVKTGGSPGSGIKVEEILPDSVVLSYRGTQFRLRALNSWVNL